MASSLAAVGLTLASCSRDSGGDAGSAAGPISLMVPLYGTAPDPEGELQTAIEEFLGRTLDVSWVPAADYPDRMTVTMASGDVPQLLTVMGKDATFIRSAQAGAFWDLTDRLSGYPNLQVPDPETALASSVNGAQYGLFRRRPALRATALFRQDWLDELGIDIPESIEDLRTTAEAFVSERPGGSENTGLVMSEWGSSYGGDSPYEYIETWFGAPNVWGERDGRLIPAFDTEEFFEAQRFMRSLREDGLMNADFATLSASDVTSKFYTGAAGISVTTDDLSGFADLFDEDEPGTGASFIANAGNLIGPDGERHAHPTTGYNGIIAISKESTPTEDDLDAVLSIFDKLNSEEGRLLLRLGLEGVSYEQDGEYFNPIDGPEAETIRSDVGGFQQLDTNLAGHPDPQPTPPSDGYAAMLDRRDELRARDLETAVRNPALQFVSETQLAQGAVLSQIIGDARVKFIAGEIDESGYQDEIARWHSSGGDDVIAEINELYEAQ